MNLTHALKQYSVTPGHGTASQWVDRVNGDFPFLRVGTHASQFTGHYRGAASSQLQISDIASSAHVIDRPAKRSDPGADLFKISYQLRGTGSIRQGRHELRFRPGTITLYDAAHPYQIEFENDMRFVVAMFPKSALQLPPGMAADLRAHQLDANDATSRSLGVLLTQLAENLPLLNSAPGEQLGRVALDLVNALLSERLDVVTEKSLGEIRRRALDFIDSHLSQPDLSPTLIAASLFISLRRLHTAFEESGTTVTKWIRERRLAECRRFLVDPLHNSAQIRDIARDHGFADMSLFSRRFRERFGESPSEFRERHLRHEVRIGMH